jgi:hypothetical protein
MPWHALPCRSNPSPHREEKKEIHKNFLRVRPNNGFFDTLQKANDNEALRWSCKNGHLHVADWLKRTFDLCPSAPIVARRRKTCNKIRLQ